jgi:hypothetical protein
MTPRNLPLSRHAHPRQSVQKLLLPCWFQTGKCAHFSLSISSIVQGWLWCHPSVQPPLVGATMVVSWDGEGRLILTTSKPCSRLAVWTDSERADGCSPLWLLDKGDRTDCEAIFVLAVCQLFRQRGCTASHMKNYTSLGLWTSIGTSKSRVGNEEKLISRTDREDAIRRQYLIVLPIR